MGIDKDDWLWRSPAQKTPHRCMVDGPGLTGQRGRDIHHKLKTPPGWQGRECDVIDLL